MKLGEPQKKQLRKDPVIVLGMHHSGTSILAEVLHRNGIFMQPNWRHYESKFFARDINERLILEDEAGWARLPLMPVKEIMQKYEIVKKTIEKRAYMKYIASGYDGQSRWGFKDPRTCITLPLFLRIFPNAYLIHISRREDDVAASLASSFKRGVGLNRDREHWKALRQAYIERIHEFGTKHERFMEISYEKFCQKPVAVMQEVFDFLGVAFQTTTKQFLQEKIYTHRINIA